MQKTTSALLGSLVLIVTGVVVWGTIPRKPAEIIVPTMGSSTPQPPTLSSASDAGTDSPTILDDPSFQGVRSSKPGFALLDGSKPPPLPPEAPERVRFGVILVQYRGAERAPLTARSKSEALTLTTSLVELAKSDFVAAVEKGDNGSVASAGWMPRGILEPAPNYVLFTTPPGQVSGPVDTPTGFWILKNVSKPK